MKDNNFEFIFWTRRIRCWINWTWICIWIKKKVEWYM